MINYKKKSIKNDNIQCLNCKILSLDGSEIIFKYSDTNKGLDLRIEAKQTISKIWGFDILKINLIEIPSENSNQIEYQCLIMDIKDNKQNIYSYSQDKIIEIDENDWEIWNVTLKYEIDHYYLYK